MKEDILEQIAEDYYKMREGFFTKHNLKFRPSKNDKNYLDKYDSVHSDIDLVVINCKKRNHIIVVSCKSWQGGLNISYHKSSIEKAISKQPIKTIGKRDDWCMFRELCIHKWTDAFLQTVRAELSYDSKRRIELEYVILCTKIIKKSIKDRRAFENSKIINGYFKKKRINLTLRVMTIDNMLEGIINAIANKDTPSVENTHLSRTLQLIIAAGYVIKKDEDYNHRKKNEIRAI